MTCRGWCFTWNQPEDYDYDQMGADYVIVGVEKAPTTGRVHHQGYAHWPAAHRFEAIRLALPEGAHIERAKGTAAQNREYCVKDSEIFCEIGEVPQQGKRNDMAKVRQLLATGGGMKAVVGEAPSYQAMKAGELILKYAEPMRSAMPYVKWLWGPSGTGKTMAAFAEAVDPWISGRDLRWWDGYDGHAHVILDDFRPEHCSFTELLRICDRYPYRVETKGGSRQLRCTHIWVTSSLPPEACVPRGEEPRQLLRRIAEVVNLAPK